MDKITQGAVNAFKVAMPFSSGDTDVTTTYGVGGLVIETTLWLRGIAIAYTTQHGTWVQPRGIVDGIMVDRLNGLLGVSESYIRREDDKVYACIGNFCEDITNGNMEVKLG